jgi:hypothetical protein
VQRQRTIQDPLDLRVGQVVDGDEVHERVA